MLSSHYALAQGPLSNLADQLEKADCYRAEATFSVLLPNAEDPVSYNVKLESKAQSGDTLSPVAYLVEWEADSAANAGGNGFCAYFDGNFFRYTRGKLQENHAADNAVPFAPGGNIWRGVQHRDNYASLLPYSLAVRLREMDADSTYEVKVADAGGRSVVKGSQRKRGYTISEFEYVFDSDGMPLSWEVTGNPGEMTEQLVTAAYRLSPGNCSPITEPRLIDSYPEEFERFRHDSFSLNSLKGTPLPDINEANTAGGRFSHHRGEPMGRPVVMAVTSCSVDGNEDMIASLRSAMDALPFSADLVVAFVDTDLEAVEETMGTLRPGETALRNSRAMVRDLGIVDFPSIIFVKSDGTVSDIHVGRNNKLCDIVISKTMAGK